jgi:ArsR family transcriptional regulator
MRTPIDPAMLQANAIAVAELLNTIGNARRLMVLCKLVERGEMTVSEIANAVELSQSALSQHLAKMRDEGLVTFRRESQTLWYRIADARLEALLGALYDLYCHAAPPQKG